MTPELDDALIDMANDVGQLTDVLTVLALVTLLTLIFGWLKS